MNIQQLFHTLDHQVEGIPFQQIQSLCEIVPTEELFGKIKHVLKVAYKEETMLGESKLYTPHSALWYAIVAECQYSAEFPPIIVDLLTDDSSIDWDLMNEQLLVLVGSCCEKDPSSVSVFLDGIEKVLKDKKQKTAYNYLFESVYFTTPDHHQQIERIVSSLGGFDQTIFISMLLEFDQSKYLPVARSIVKSDNDFADKNSMEFNMNKELLTSIEMAETTTLQNRCYYKNRGAWKQHYKRIESLFKTEAPSLAVASNSVHRNDPCSCGSGKKYKKCCGILSC